MTDREISGSGRAAVRTPLKNEQRRGSGGCWRSYWRRTQEWRGRGQHERYGKKAHRQDEGDGERQQDRIGGGERRRRQTRESARTFGDRQSVVQGKGGSGSVDLGCRRYVKKNKKKIKNTKA